MDRLGAMSVFVSVVTAGSLSAASRELRMPLPTVSRKVAELESHLAVKLLVRGTRKLALTESGEAYLASCRRILEAVAEAERGAAGAYHAPQGELVVTAPVTFGRLHVIPVAAEFLAAHGSVDLRLVLSDRPLNLIDDHLDLALRVGELPDSSLVASRIGKHYRAVPVPLWWPALAVALKTLHKLGFAIVKPDQLNRLVGEKTGTAASARTTVEGIRRIGTKDAK